MAYSNIEKKPYLVLASLAANAFGDAIEVRNIKRGSLFVTWTGASATDATVKAQRNHDPSNPDGWQDISGASVTIGAAAGSKEIPLIADTLLSPYVRAVYTKNAETTGIANVAYFFKGV